MFADEVNMKVTCPYCGKVEVQVFGEPFSKCAKVCNIRDVVRPLSELLAQLTACLVCRERAFDGWHCHKCTNTISDNAKKARPCILLNNKESVLVTRHFQEEVIGECQ